MKGPNVSHVSLSVLLGAARGGWARARRASGGGACPPTLYLGQGSSAPAQCPRSRSAPWCAEFPQSNGFSEDLRLSAWRGLLTRERALDPQP